MEFPDFLLAAPEIFLLGMVCAILLVDLFLPDSRRAWTYGLTQVSLVATAALVYIAAFGGHEFKWKEVTILYVVLIVFSVLVFVKGLTLPFPLWPAAFD